ncbi:MAG: TerB N-terminal domain-containing protein [Clostridia bacterium]|nr:TerB N-terminal domain-containing protein [Clostridia bacterium]
MAEKNHRSEELDRFWSIDELLPRKQGGMRTPPQAHSTETVELVIDAPHPTRDSENPQPDQAKAAEVDNGAPLVKHDVPLANLTQPSKKPEPIDTYQPSNSLIHTVRIYRWPSAYRYYERFVEDARRYWHAEASPCPREPFFSYVPQYTQLTENRLNWYLYWRGQVRLGNYPDCDYTYLLLYLYEIINLGQEIEPQAGLSAICALWQGYRARYPRLDRFLGEWICDYCLVHHLPAPDFLPDDALDILIAGSPFKEFWLNRPGEHNRAYVDALIRFASNYDYRKSKFATGENLPLYDRHIPAALSHTVDVFSANPDHPLAGGNLQDSILSRDAFGGALCAHENKYRIEIEYCSFTRSHELRFLVTDMIKYSENKLRAHLGIKSRLGLYALPHETRAVLDDYFAKHLPARQAMTPAKRAEAAEEKRYAPLYEPLSTTLSPQNAAAIEQSSWQMTQRLVEAFDEKEDSLPVSTPIPMSALPSAPAAALPGTQEGLVGQLISAHLDGVLRALCKGDMVAAKAEAKANGLMLDAAVDLINNAAQDAFGDILLEEKENGSFGIIEDYLDELTGL